MFEVMVLNTRSLFFDEEHVMHSKYNDIETMINDKPDEVIEELF